MKDLTDAEIGKLIDRMWSNRLRESMFETWNHIDQWGLKCKGMSARDKIVELHRQGYRITAGYSITNVWGYHDRHILWK